MKKRLKLPGIDTIKEKYVYDSGRLLYKKSGIEAGTVTKLGYRQIGIDKKNYLAHRLIYKMFYNLEPDYIDHIDGNPSNNKIENLQAITHQLNRIKGAGKLYKHNKSGTTGVFFNNNRNVWQARIIVKDKIIHLGQFNSVKDAIKARKLAEKEYIEKYVKVA